MLKTLFSHKGRLNRKPFLLWYVALNFVFSLLSGLFPNKPDVSDSLLLIIVLLMLLYLFFILNLVIKRFHDLNMSGKYCFAILIPVYNLYFLLYKLPFVKGTEGPNRYGKDLLKK